MSPSTSTISGDFLTGPGPQLVKQPIHFGDTPLHFYKDLYAVILDNVFTPSECATLVDLAEARTNGTWEQALVNVGSGQQRQILDVRDCGRIIWDDRDVVARIWDRIKGAVPEIDILENKPKITGYGPTKRKETWKMSRLNERMRFLKYGKGHYFRPHCDGSFVTDDGKEISFCTLHLYLNGSDPKSPDGILEGGSTTFHSDSMKHRLDVVPKVGRVLVFQHKGLLHSGDDVTNGIKLTMRTDLMYKKIDADGNWY